MMTLVTILTAVKTITGANGDDEDDGSGKHGSPDTYDRTCLYPQG